MQHEHLLVRLGHLGAVAERQTGAHRAEGAGVEAMPGHERRNRLAPEVQDLLAVDDEDRVALDEVADLLAEPQRMDRCVVRRHRLLGLRVLLAVDDTELADPRRVFLGIELALGFLPELLEDGARVAHDRDLDVAVPPDLRGVDVDVNDFQVLREARRRAELHDPVEAHADRENDVRLTERGAARIEERERMVVRCAAARERRRVERDAARFDERLERLGGVRPPHAAAAEDDRARRLSEERDRFLHRALVTPRARQRLPRRRIHHARLVDLLTEDVAGKVEIHGPDASGRRLAEGGREMFGDAARVVDPLRPLRDRLEHGELIDLLERLHAERHARARAADGDER